MKRKVWLKVCFSLIVVLGFCSSGYARVLFSDTFVNEGTAGVQDLQDESCDAGRSGVYAASGYLQSPAGLTYQHQVKTTNELFLSDGGKVAPNVDMSGSDSAGGISVSVDMNPARGARLNSEDWCCIVVGGSGLSSDVGADGFGVLFRKNGTIQAWDNAAMLVNDTVTWNATPDDVYHNIQITATDATDSNPFDGVGTTTFEIFVDGSSIYSIDLAGADYPNNYVILHGQLNSYYDNLVISQFSNPDTVSNRYPGTGETLIPIDVVDALEPNGVGNPPIVDSSAVWKFTTRLFSSASFSEGRKQFHCPPDKYRPYTWWHWMDGNVTKEGITTDLEAMNKAGIGGVLMFHVNQGIPAGPVRFGTPEFEEMIQFSITECDRLGLEFGVHNCDGWSSSGGPWVKPEHSMKFVTYTETLIEGGRKLDLKLPKPFRNMNYSDDIGVFAFPATTEDIQLMAVNKTVRSSRSGVDASKLIDNDMTSKVMFPKPEKAPYDSVILEYEKVVEIGGFRVVPAGLSMDKFKRISWISPYEITFYVSLDGKDFKKIGNPVRVEQGMTKIHTFLKSVKGKAFKFEITGFQWVENVELAELELLPPSRMIQLEGKVMKTPEGNWMNRSYPTADSEIISRDNVIDITKYMGADGRLKWHAPLGQWVILRLSQTTRARENTPPSIEGKGLEVDKLSKKAADVFWDGYVGNLIDQAEGNSAFKYVEVDSWEVGYQNWTDQMDVRFEKRTGYSMRPFLPVFSGRIVDSEEMTGRFLWDFRRVIADMAAENYIGYFQEKAQRHGMGMYNEPYHGPFDSFEFGGKVFSPMGEFWVGGNRMHTCKLAASVGHVYGKEVISAEAFTADISKGAWDNHPYTLKALGDNAFTSGVNQFVFHRFTHQPYPNANPGMTMGPWGAHIDRTQTWWQPAAKSWFDYLHRSQYMLRQGRFFADVAFYTGERQPHNDDVRNIAFGYDYDAFSREILLSADVKNGQIVLPSGMRYNLLVLPDDQKFMSLQVAKKIQYLAKQGAKILGKKKPEDSPGLIGYPNHSKLVKEIVDDLWDNKHIIQDKTITEAVGVPEDFSYTSQTEAKLKYIHRVLDDVDFYFVANSKGPQAKVKCHFRVKGKVPELWYPETGKIEPAKAWRETAHGIEVAMVLNDSESVFVVFAESSDNVEYSTNIELPEIKTEIIQTLDGPWKLKFPKSSGAPESVVLDSLISWTDHEHFDVKHFSGTATYVKSFNVEEKHLKEKDSVWIDLGEVHEIAEVSLNGQAFAVLWKPPFKIDISDVIKPGINKLEIKVTNLWRNRLIGDEHYPVDIPRWGEKGGIKFIPDWVKKGERRPEPDRKAATFFIHWGKNDPLLNSGLLGPVNVFVSSQN